MKPTTAQPAFRSVSADEQMAFGNARGLPATFHGMAEKGFVRRTGRNLPELVEILQICNTIDYAGKIFFHANQIQNNLTAAPARANRPPSISQLETAPRKPQHLFLLRMLRIAMTCMIGSI